MSVMMCVAWSKILLPFPASFRMFVNVNRRFSPDWIASSSIPVFFIIALARSVTCFAVTWAAAPVDLMTLFVCAVTFTDCVHSSQPIFNVATAPRNTRRPEAQCGGFRELPDPAVRLVHRPFVEPGGVRLEDGFQLRDCGCHLVSSRLFGPLRRPLRLEPHPGRPHPEQRDEVNVRDRNVQDTGNLEVAGPFGDAVVCSVEAADAEDRGPDEFFPSASLG
jgi:hypothetical protein